jgi:hypothetical protein
MRPLTRDDIAPLETYPARRDAYREAVIAYKRARRVPIGESVTLLFEDRETLRFQVHEMLWVERIAEPEKIQHELDVYNELMPGERELSATLFVEITDPDEIRPALDRLIGIDEHVSLELGEEDARESVRARFDPKQMDEDRISAVQYIRFALDEAQARRFADPSVPAHLCIDHPNYRRRESIAPAARTQLARGLTQEPEPLLAPDRASGGGGDARALFSSERVRAVAPAQPRAPGHVVVEPVEPAGSLLDLDPTLESELLAAVKRVAGEVLRTHGSCRIHTDLGGEERGVRWHVHALPG